MADRQRLRKAARERAAAEETIKEARKRIVGSNLSSLDDLLTPEERERLTVDLAEIAKLRRLAEGDFA